MATSVTVYVNADTTDSPYGTSGVDWVEMNLTSDYWVFSNGSATVADGQPIPSQSALTQAGVVIDSIDTIVPKYFLADVSENLLKEIHNAGNQNKRYVFCFSFDGVTASEPTLELWDDSNFDSIDLYSLGEGDATESWWRGITTTDGLPGADWTGSKLAGDSDTHFLWLNNQNGALSGATDLYCNLKVIVPANFQYAATENPVFAVKYTTN